MRSHIFWEEHTLSELGVFSRGKSKHRPRDDKRLFENGKFPLVQTGEIKDAQLYINTHSLEYGDFGLAQSKLWDKGTLCITIAANIAETAILAYPMCFPDSVVGFTADKNKSSELFIHYIFAHIRKSIQNSASGSIQDNINIEYLTNLKFKIPQKDYQDKIVEILSALDNKVDLNSKINTELESIAQTIYDYWFVQFDFPDEAGRPYKSSGGEMVYSNALKRNIPAEWEVGILKSFIKQIKTGLNPRDNFILGNGNIRYITVKNITTDGTLDFNNCDIVDEKAQKIIHNRSNISKGDILFASIAPLGRCYLIQETPSSWDINESVFSIRPDFEKISSEYLYMHLTNQQFIKKAQNSSTGSIFTGIRIQTLENMIFIIPPIKILEAFTELVGGIYRQKFINERETERLIQIRDFLLPMLMNGQVSVV